MRQVLAMFLVFGVLFGNFAVAAKEPSSKLQQIVFPSIPLDIGDKIRCGMSENDVARLMNSRGCHQFTIRQSGVLMRCVEYRHLDNLRHGFYFVFTNSTLVAVYKPPSFQTGNILDIYDGNGKYRYSEAEFLTPQKRIQLTLDSDNLLLQGSLKERMQSFYQKPQEPRRIDWGLTIAYVAVRGLLNPKGLARQVSGTEKDPSDAYIELGKKWSALPFQIPLNAERKEVETLLGKFKTVVTDIENTVWYYYGDIIKLDSGGIIPYPYYFWVAVTYTDDYVAGVYSADFLDRNIVKPFLPLQPVN